MKIKKQFYYEGILLQIVEREEPYLNSGATVKMTRVIGPTGEVVPVKISRNQTLTSIIEDTGVLLDGFAKRGADVKKELTGKKTMLTKAQLEIEVQELTEALKDSDTELKSVQEDLELLKKETDKRVEDLETELEELKDKVPTIKSLEDEIKHELFVEYFNKISLINFENFIKALEFY